MKHIVGFSGGIDSQACARWVLNRYPAKDVILMNSEAGKNEHPLTVDFVAWYSANIHPVVKVESVVADLWDCSAPKAKVHVSSKAAHGKGFTALDALDFGDMIELKGRGPSSQAQFCTDILKLRPQLRWIRENVADDFERYTGKRRDESRSRRETPYREWDDFYDCYLNHVLMDWSKPMCFEYVKSHGEQINPLYMMGFSRVGCFPCVNWNKEDIRTMAIRAPEAIDKVRAWETQSGRTFFPPMVPGLPMNNIDQVVEWAMTARGGRQQMFPVMHEREACESRYGLCD